MRPNQQNMNKQRSRGRNNNNNNNNQRRGGGGNPLSRNYESNGPDVKIRGNASHIAEKYTQLARDAAASGDNVMAENYLQHAEHYNRIILAAQAQFQPRQDQQAEASSDDESSDDETVTAEATPETVEAENKADAGSEEGRPRRAQRQRRPRRETTEDVAKAEGNDAEPPSEPAPAAAAEANSTAEADEKPKRARRTPRRTTKKADADLGETTQPDLGELPAFLTAGREAAAE